MYLKTKPILRKLSSEYVQDVKLEKLANVNGMSGFCTSICEPFYYK